MIFFIRVIPFSFMSWYALLIFFGRFVFVRLFIFISSIYRFVIICSIRWFVFISSINWFILISSVNWFILISSFNRFVLLCFIRWLGLLSWRIFWRLIDLEVVRINRCNVLIVFLLISLFVNYLSLHLLFFLEFIKCFFILIFSQLITISHINMSWATFFCNNLIHIDICDPHIDLRFFSIKMSLS